MFARKLKNNIIEIVNKESHNELISHAFIPDLSAEDAVCLIFAASNIKSLKDNVMTISYQNDEHINKIFKGIVMNKLKQAEKEGKTQQPLTAHLPIDALPGQSVLIRDPTKQTIAIALRKTTKSTQIGINRVFINEIAAKSFFRDAKKSKYFANTHKYIIDSEDKGLYQKWSDFMDKLYPILVTESIKYMHK